MRYFALVSTIVLVLSVLSTQTVQGQDRAKHPRMGTVLSSLDAYTRWQEQVDSTNEPSLMHQGVAAVTKRLDTQTASVDLTIGAKDLSWYQGAAGFVVEIQPFKYRIDPNGDFSRQSLGKRTQLDLPAASQPENSDGTMISNPTLTFLHLSAQMGLKL